MITSYKIKKINDEEVLIIYLDNYQEFSLEWLEKVKDKTIRDFIKYKKITWNGTKIFLVVGGVTLAILNYSPTSNKLTDKFTYVGLNQNILSTEIVDKVNNDIIKNNEVVEKEETIDKEDIFVENNNSNQGEINNNKEEINNQQNNQQSSKPPTNNNNTSNNNTSKPVVKPPVNNNSSDNNSTNENTPSIKDEITIPDKEPTEEIKPVETKTYVTVNRSNGQVIKLELNEYLIGVVAGEMPASFNKEALKVQSIIARTYVLNAINKGIQITDTVSTQRYIDTNEMKKLWGNSYNTYYNKIKESVLSTENMVVTYNNNLIECVYHSTSNGKTEDSKNVWGNSFPYLQSVDSHWDKETSSYFRTINITKQDLSTKLGITDITKITILSRNESGRVEKVKVNDKIYTGVEFRNKLGLRSADFDITIDKDNIKIDTRGYGHGVGLSQYGANGMAKEGCTYEQIIKHYYKGVEITNNKK